MINSRLWSALPAFALLALAGCSSGAQNAVTTTDLTPPVAAVSDPDGSTTSGASTGSADAAPVRADVQAPNVLMVGSTCERDDDRAISACVNYSSDVATFTAPGDSATGGATLVSFAQTESHGEIHSTFGPPSPIGFQQPVWASYQSKGAGIEAYVKYHVRDDPYRSADEVGWSIDMPYAGDDSGECIDSTFLFCEKRKTPGDKEYHATYEYHFFNRPLAVVIHNNVQGLELTKQGPETMAGLLVDPIATNQAEGNAVLSFDVGGNGGKGFFGGYRSKNDDATFAVQYEVTKAAVAGDVGTTLNIQATVNKDDPNKVSPGTTCAVSAPSSATRLQCKVQVNGTNAGQSKVIVEISKN